MYEADSQKLSGQLIRPLIRHLFIEIDYNGLYIIYNGYSGFAVVPLSETTQTHKPMGPFLGSAAPTWFGTNPDDKPEPCTVSS